MKTHTFRPRLGRYASSDVPRVAVLSGRERFDHDHAERVLAAREWVPRPPDPEPYQAPHTKRVLCAVRDMLAPTPEDHDTLWDELIEERRAHEESRRRMQALTGWLVWCAIIAFVAGAAAVWGLR